MKLNWSFQSRRPLAYLKIIPTRLMHKPKLNIRFRASENELKFIVLDLPNPLGRNRVEGDVLDPKFSSFVGFNSIPLISGMTVGELAKLFNAEFDINCDLTVIPMQGWQDDLEEFMLKRDKYLICR